MQPATLCCASTNGQPCRSDCKKAAEEGDSAYVGAALGEPLTEGDDVGLGVATLGTRKPVARAPSPHSTNLKESCEQLEVDAITQGIAIPPERILYPLASKGMVVVNGGVGKATSKGATREKSKG